METIREIIFSREFDEFYHNLDERTQEKYDYAFDMIRTQYIVNKRFVKSLENTDFYELRISIGHNEYRSIMLAIDHDNFIQAHRVLVLNSFLKKDSKQYKAEVRTAESILMKNMAVRRVLNAKSLMPKLKHGIMQNCLRMSVKNRILPKSHWLKK